MQTVIIDPTAVTVGSIPTPSAIPSPNSTTRAQYELTVPVTHDNVVAQVAYNQAVIDEVCGTIVTTAAPNGSGAPRLSQPRAESDPAPTASADRALSPLSRVATLIDERPLRLKPHVAIQYGYLQ
jgi:hypothetical protein